MRGVVHGQGHGVTLAHHQHLGRVRVARQHRVEVQRIRRALGYAVVGQVGEVHVLDAAEHLARAGGVEVVAGDRIPGQAVDGQRGAPPGGVAALAVELGHPARRVQLQFQERHPRVPGAGPGIDDVAVAVRGARGDLLRVGPRVAQVQAEPEGRPQLEAVREAVVGRRCGVLRQGERVLHVVAGAVLGGVEVQLGLVVADVVAERFVGVEDLGAQHARRATVGQLACGARRGGRGCGYHDRQRRHHAGGQ